jgi:hypothetical protein
MKSLTLTLFCLSLPVLAWAGSPSPVLLPTLYSGPGALGSHWDTAVVINNHEPFAFKSVGVEFAILCTIPEGCYSDEVPAGAFGAIANPFPAHGLLLYLPSESADISFMARIAALPRHTLTGGTELPVVHEREFTRTRINLPYVPFQSYPTRLRTTLRIYGPDAQPGTSVSVELRFWDCPVGSPEFSKTVVLQVPSGTGFPPIFPAYALVNLQDEFPLAVYRSTYYNVTVVPLSLASGGTPRIWAFITITDNSTQEVTVQRPQ